MECLSNPSVLHFICFPLWFLFETCNCNILERNQSCYCKHLLQMVAGLLVWYASLMLNYNAERGALTFRKLLMHACTKWKGLSVQKALFGLMCRRQNEKLLERGISIAREHPLGSVCPIQLLLYLPRAVKMLPASSSWCNSKVLMYSGCLQQSDCK